MPNFFHFAGTPEGCGLPWLRRHSAEYDFQATVYQSSRVTTMASSGLSGVWNQPIISDELPIEIFSGMKLLRKNFDSLVYT